MSWSISIIGKPGNLVAALLEESDKLSDQSKLEFDEALPHLIGLVQENFAAEQPYVEPVIHLEANGSGISRAGKQLSRSCQVKMQNFYSRLV